MSCDVADPDQCANAVKETVDGLGRVDVLVNNAGIGTAVPATRESPDEFRKVIDINLNGSYWMAQACAKAMEPGSAIVNIGSVLGHTTAGLPQAAYAASKAAVEGLTRDLASQWTTRKGIRVNALAPGLLPLGDDRAVPRRLPGHDDAARPRPAGRATPRSWPPRWCSWPATPPAT